MNKSNAPKIILAQLAPRFKSELDSLQPTGYHHRWGLQIAQTPKHMGVFKFAHRHDTPPAHS